MEKENREYKDSVFCDIFYTDQDAKKNLLELYNALYDQAYEDPELIQFVRLEDVLYKNFKNDVAFTVNNESIILSEHQSTVNENLPLRNLMYIGREYEKVVPVEKRYKREQVKIPTPIFVTFYNGTEAYPPEKELKLSDAFASINHSEVFLELNVKVININLKAHHKILEKCRILREYSEFVEITRSCRQDQSTLKDAICECIKRDILKEYLERKSGEVVNMLMAEYNYELDIAVQREEAESHGIKKGITIGKAEFVVELLEELGNVPEDLRKRIMEEKDQDTLAKWHRLAAKANLIEEFMDKM